MAVQPRPLGSALTRSRVEIQSLFAGLKTPQDVAELLELAWPQLYYITSQASDRYRYRTFSVPKKGGGGDRSIQHPHRTVKILQRKLLSVLELVYTPHPAAHGFVANKGILSNASPHVGKRLILNLDVKDFFPSITFPRVRGLFIKRFGLPPVVATVLARICCNTGDEPDHLAQGSPTSPIISNMICHSMDRQFVTLAKRNGLYYTRYADDLTFSTNRKVFPDTVASMHDRLSISVGSAVHKVLEDNGFVLNESKVRMQPRSVRQAVTGLTVNERTNLRRSRYRELRGILHAWNKYGLDGAADRYHSTFSEDSRNREFARVVAGKLAYLRQIRGVDDQLFRRLYERAQQLDPSLRQLPTLRDQPASLAAAARDLPAITANMSASFRRQYLKRMFASARGTLWLVDSDIPFQAIQDMAEAVSTSRVKAVRILTKSRVKGKDASAFDAIKSGLAAKSISVDWRLSSASHDRFMIDDDTSVYMGVYNYFYSPKPKYTQIRVTDRPAQLEDWWAKGSGT